MKIELKMIKKIVIVCSFTLSLALGSGSLLAQNFPSECDEACLLKVADDFLGAVAAADASLLSWNGYARFTMNGIELPFSEVIWSTGGRVWDKYKVVVPDVENGQVAIITTMELDTYPSMLAVRLKVEWGRLSEVETIIAVQTGEGGFSDFAELDTMDPLLAEQIPAAEQHTREELIAITDLYFEGIVQNSSMLARFDDECARVENGGVTAGAANRMNNPPTSGTAPGRFGDMACQEQFESGRFAYITEIDPRRYEVVDPSRGLVFAVVRFNSDGVLQQIELKDGSVIDAPVNYPASTLIGELFKIVDGKIIRVEAIGERVHYRAPTGWGE